MLRVKHIITFAVVLAAAGVSATVRVSVQPQEVFVGETAWYTVVSNLGVPTQVKLPEVEGLTWLPGGGRTGQRSYRVNGKTSFQGSISYAFRCDNEGTVVIPGVEAVENGKRVTGPAVKVTVKKRRFTASEGQTLTLDDLISLNVSFPGLSQKTVFLGQQIPVRITFAVAQQLEPQFSYPVLNVSDAVIKDFSGENSDSAQFSPGRIRSRIKDGIRFSEVTFETALTPLATGVLAIKGTLSVTIYPDGRRRGFVEDLMGMRRGGQERTVTIPFPEIEVVPPPELPADAGQYLGLVGSWTVDFSLSSETAKVGEPVTAALTVKGTGGTSGFTVPELAVPNYRVYDPEIKKDAATGETTVSWALIPLSRQAGDIPLTVCTLDPADGGIYVSHSFSEKLAISAGEPTGGTTNVYIPDTAREAGEPDKNGQSSLLYIKNQPGTDIPLPLTRNHSLIRRAATGLGILFFAACMIVRRLRPQAPDESTLRRRQAIKRRRDVIRKLEKACNDQERMAARARVVNWLVDMWGCPPGTSAVELADIAEKKAPDLAADLRALDYDEFAPEKASEKVNASRLAAGLRRLKSLVLIFTLGLVWHCARADEAATFQAGVAAYDAGEYDRAERIFSRLDRVDAENPVLLYNRANCLFESGKPALALALYGRALKLNPRDSDIRENLNYVRSSLGLPVRGAARDPGELMRYIRDSLRPDEWLLIAGLVIGAGGIAGGLMVLRRRRGGRIFVAGVVIGLGLYTVALRQQATSYRTDSQAVITSRQAVAWRNPSTTAPKARVIPPYGEDVEIVARRTGWVMVKNGASEIWIQEKFLHPVW